MGRHGVRATWTAIPSPVRDDIDALLGARVVAAVNIDGGFSPGPAARCELSDGRTVFVKAAGLDLNPQSPGMHRREAEVLASLDAQVPAPELIGVVDDGDWVALVIEWVRGRMPRSPLTRPDVVRLLDLVARLGVLGNGHGFEPCAQVHAELFGHWQHLLDHPIDGLDPTIVAHLADLAALEAEAPTSVQGDRLVHMDVRSDNVVFARSSAADDVVVDWPGASLGAPWVDLVALLPSLELDGGPSPEDVFTHHPIGRDAPPDAVNAFLAAITGYFIRKSLLPPPPGLPTLRPFQAAQGVIALRWLGQRIGWTLIV